MQDVPAFGISDCAENISATVSAFKWTHQSESSAVLVGLINHILIRLEGPFKGGWILLHWILKVTSLH